MEIVLLPMWKKKILNHCFKVTLDLYYIRVQFLLNEHQHLHQM